MNFTIAWLIGLAGNLTILYGLKKQIPDNLRRNRLSVIPLIIPIGYSIYYLLLR